MQFLNKVKKPKDTSVLMTLNKPASEISEHFRTVRTNIQFSMVANKLKTIVVTSAGSSVGKSTIAANLAASFASSNKKVLLVDANLRDPSLHNLFSLENNDGLTRLLMDSNTDLEEITYTNYSEMLCILNSGVIPPNPAELLSSDRMKAVIKEMEKSFDLIIFDMPSILSFTDAQIMAALTDGVVFVISKGKDQKEQVAKSKALLDHVNANVLGVVFNKSERSEGAYY